MRERGFTLIELMIVITIVALASAVVVMIIPDPRGRIRDDAERFASRARAAHDAAIVSARPVSVWVTAGGYGFDQRVGGRWQAMGDKPLRVAEWGRGIQAVPAGAGGRDRVVFDPTGMADQPMTVELRRDGQSMRVSVGINGAVRVGG
ncbi:GspH/FimT family pseudopilin [Sphingomonas bacterium]|uniref:GspH/FimT family pseudopilin n=1 Tax=Sphingomonas bacterium TaxID=1895847 RepID=UPI002615717D|nr:GspH/FimT family pseudopilin [Sphingomonas bacterium]MDB5679186.1 ral secretion pathway protein GspH [Sphingomonas bacterium]